MESIEEYKRYLIDVIKERQQLLDKGDEEYIEGLIDGLALASFIIEKSK